MVSVSLIPRKGNHTKFFPHSGHLGLTPVIVAGTLKLEWAEDERPVEVAEALVRLRCYEAIGGQAEIGEHAISENHPHQNLNLLWQTVSSVWPPANIPSALSFHPPPGYQSDWRLVVPRSATDHSHHHSQHGGAVGSMTYKNWKSWWQLEAVVRVVHLKKKTITKCYPVHLKNFHPLSSLGTLTHVQGSTHNPLITYSVSHPAQVSCGDVVTVNVSLEADRRQDNQHPASFKKVIISLERSMVVDGDLIEQAKPTNLPDDGRKTSTTRTGFPSPDSFPKPMDGPMHRLRCTQSLGKLRAKARSPSRAPANPKALVSVIQSADIPISKDDKDSRASLFSWNGRVDLVIPRPKSAYHYSIGDTCKTKFISVAYHVKAQVVIKPKKGNTEIVDLGRSEVELSSVPTLDRESACRNYRRLPQFGKFQETASALVVDSKNSRYELDSKSVAPSTLTV